jgi:excisionase family DNA binding protein
MVLMHTSPIPEDVPAFLTTGEFARRVGLSPATIKRLCGQGELAYVVISDRGDRRIPASEVDRLVAEAQANRSQGLA